MKTSTLRAMMAGDPPQGALPLRYELCKEVVSLREALKEALDLVDAVKAIIGSWPPTIDSRALLTEHDDERK